MGRGMKRHDADEYSDDTDGSWDDGISEKKVLKEKEDLGQDSNKAHVIYASLSPPVQQKLIDFLCKT